MCSGKRGRYRKISGCRIRAWLDIGQGNMTNWTEPKYTAPQINLAGKLLVNLYNDEDAQTVQSEEYENALVIINNYRSAHSRPLHTFYVGLKRKAKSISSEATIARRIKRLSSIESKLNREINMKLSQMQDIGGGRAIMKNILQVRKLVNLYTESDLKHTLVNHKDYIDEPKASGYRGIHLVWRYKSDKNKTWNDLKIELQLRSRLQHAWATAVETYGTFTK